jgi:type IV pilus assembly protein PilA
MLIKMRESKGFTLVELMIVVAIIGILAAVAVPYYQRYVAKSRLTSLVMPAIHSIETNIGTYYAVQSGIPSLASGSSTPLSTFTGDADTRFIDIGITDWTVGSATPQLKVTVRTDVSLSSDSTKFPFSSFAGVDGRNVFYMVATVSPDAAHAQKLYWSYGGTLAKELGL